MVYMRRSTWLDKVCAATDGLTSQEIADIAGEYGQHSYPSDLMCRLRSRKGVSVEMLGLARDLRGDESIRHNVRFYRVTRRQNYVAQILDIV